MKRSHLTILIFLASLAMAVLITAFFYTHEQVEEEVWVGFRGEARSNPFLAAEKFLAEVGLETETLNEFDIKWDLPPYEDSLFLAANYSEYDEWQLQSLFDWVSNGGHLIVSPWLEDEDPLLQWLGLNYELIEDEANSTVAQDALKSEFADLNAWPQLYFFNEERFINDNSEINFVYDGQGAVAARVSVDDGIVTVLISDSIFSNDEIADADHAAFLLSLLTEVGDPGRVWLVYQHQFRSLAKLIWEYARILLFATVVLVILALWHFAPRFGPLMAERLPRRRALSEHIDASGHFLWRHSVLHGLASETETAVLDKLRQSHWHLADASDQDCKTYFREKFTKDEVDLAFAKVSGDDKQGFVEKMKILNLMWKKL